MQEKNCGIRQGNGEVEIFSPVYLSALRNWELHNEELFLLSLFSRFGRASNWTWLRPNMLLENWTSFLRNYSNRWLGKSRVYGQDIADRQSPDVGERPYWRRWAWDGTWTPSPASRDVHHSLEYRRPVEMPVALFQAQTDERLSTEWSVHPGSFISRPPAPKKGARAGRWKSLGTRLRGQFVCPSFMQTVSPHWGFLIHITHSEMRSSGGDSRTRKSCLWSFQISTQFHPESLVWLLRLNREQSHGQYQGAPSNIHCMFSKTPENIFCVVSREINVPSLIWSPVKQPNSSPGPSSPPTKGLGNEVVKKPPFPANWSAHKVGLIDENVSPRSTTVQGQILVSTQPQITW